ncbi:hypothetical protein SUGI_0605980 [Cryptomeria japonica]|uniref:putative NAC domain-containing protein 94 n=1 Tax=Cryptomeria japonica TaxID=3369 RepID=UPI002414C191|nr:putative NAC domain-containing protein 94 [Cryptomeria japonica]GLJ30603.1 hypothetical protein SUGI_0605980 [Cryptomeria japonica]
MEQKNELDQGDEIMLPGFRFHPTDEELVAFYLRRKVQKRPLSIELIKQLDIYKFDPWDLPKMASIGEKEWYFYCPRDRKYRNSNRPNRVTTAGFWKATGTDRPIYSSDGTNCIGLKKSLVFYKGRAAKGIKTDWMMHEFRLPTQLPVSSPSKRPLDKDLPPNDSWAICRIFKKSTVAQRVPHHMWTPPMVDRSFESSCNNNYSYNNIMDIPQPKAGTGDVQTHPASTNAIPSSIMAGTEEFQFLNQQQPTNMAFGSCKFSHAKSIPCFLPARSLSLPNLEYSNTSDQSHYNEHSAEKSTLNFVSYMLQMPPPADDAQKTQNLSPDVCTDHQQQQEAEAFLKKNKIFNSIPMPGNISLCNSLPFQSNLYDVLKGVSTNQWDIPTSAIL